MRRLPRTTLIFAGALFAANLGGAYVLDALGIVERLLSPSGAALALLVPLSAAYYVVRLLALFVAPGLLLGAGVLWLVDGRAEDRREAEGAKRAKGKGARGEEPPA